MRQRTRNMVQGSTMRVSAWRIMFFCMVVVGMLSCAGCAGIAPGIILRSADKGNLGTYATLRPTMPPIPADNGRLFVYMAEGGPDLVSTMGAYDLCTVDDDVYKLLGQTYWYTDLPVGRHKITSTGIAPGTGRPSRYGSEHLEIHLDAGQTLYCRMDVSGTKLAARLMTYTPALVDATAAEQEMGALDFHKHFRTGWKIPIGTAGLDVRTSPDKAVIRVRRTTSMTGRGTQVHIGNGRNFVGALDPGGQVAWAEPPGYALITAAPVYPAGPGESDTLGPASVAVVKLAGGRSYDLTVDFRFGGRIAIAGENSESQPIAWPPAGGIEEYMRKHDPNWGKTSER